MPTATFRFHAELNDFLPRNAVLVRNRVPFETIVSIDFSGHETVKHLLESLGIPHTEVDVILVNGQSVGFDCRLAQGDRVDVFPIHVDVDAVPLIHLQPVPLQEPRFVLDGHLGKLADYLRLLGFDTCYCNEADDDELAQISSREGRILLTRDRGLLKRSQVTYGYCVREKSPRRQVVAVVQRFDLTRFANPYTRCVHCNGLLKPVPKDVILERLEPKTKLYYDEFSICEDCGHIYWKGSHFERMEKFILGILKTEA
jgi:uncharacterized protein with PIN domain/sulfur carrier protein ThiS